MTLHSAADVLQRDKNSLFVQEKSEDAPDTGGPQSHGGVVPVIVGAHSPANREVRSKHPVCDVDQERIQTCKEKILLDFFYLRDRSTVFTRLLLQRVPGSE